MANKGINLVILAGNVCSDPELRKTQGGQSILNLRLATNDSYKDKDGSWKDTVEYHSVLIWGARGTALSKFVTKGTSVTVQGKLKTSSWEKDGVKHYKTEIVANEVVVGRADSANEGGERQQGGYARGNGGGQRSQGRPQQAPQNEAPADDDGGNFDDGSDLPF